jgi:hypothetical protein
MCLEVKLCLILFPHHRICHSIATRFLAIHHMATTTVSQTAGGGHGGQIDSQKRVNMHFLIVTSLDSIVTNSIRLILAKSQHSGKQRHSCGYSCQSPTHPSCLRSELTVSMIPGHPRHSVHMPDLFQPAILWPRRKRVLSGSVRD